MAERRSLYLIVALVRMFYLADAVYTASTAMEEVMNLKGSIEYSSIDRETVVKTVRCETNADSTKIVTITELVLLTSVPCDASEANLAIASLDLWSQSPKVVREMERSNLSVSGEIRPDNHLSSHLSVSWTSPIAYPGCSYSCLAKGVDVDGHPTSESKNVADGWVSRNDMDNITYINAIETQIQIVEERLSENLCNCTDMSTRLAVLEEKVNGQNLQAMISSLEAQTIKLSTELHNQTENLASALMWFMKISTKFDVSGLYEGRIYLMSKAQAQFNIDVANQACQEAGGYLLELDSDGEHSFVVDFIQGIGFNGHIFTGTNDIDKEGYFVHKTSKKPLTIKKWAPGEPNSGNEDCMEIYVSNGEFNDTECWATGRYICEIPFSPVA